MRAFRKVSHAFGVEPLRVSCSISILAFSIGILFLPSFAAAATPTFTRTLIDDSFAGDVKGIGDIDGDGFVDLVIGGYQMVWYRYPSWTKHILATADRQFTTDMKLADVDNDGDLDVVTGDESGPNNVVWLENPRPGGDPTGTWTKHTIGTHSTWAHDVEVADIDRDGRLDVVTRGTYTNIFFQDAPTLWTAIDLTSVVGSGGEGLGIGDVDGDGDIDLVAAGGWIEIPPSPRTGVWTKHTFASGYSAEATAAVGDLNGDARPDIVLANLHVRGKMAWYEGPANPASDPWVEHLIDSSMGSHKLNLGDLDNDGRLDIVAGLELAELAVYLNQGGATPGFAKQILSTTGLHNQVIGDVGNDGDVDIFGANYLGNPPVELWENSLSSTPPVNEPASSGDGGGGGGGGGCFIATAAFGSSMAPQVQVLREVRDTYLLPNGVGRAAVQVYYAVSPPIADVISHSEVLRAAVRFGLLPVLGWASLVLWSPGVGLVIPALPVVVGVWLVRRRSRQG